ncbi:hypothetical protein Aduo_015961 [Ancylostoma duodenale]
MKRDIKSTKITEPTTRPRTTTREVTDDHDAVLPPANIAVKPDRDRGGTDKDEDNKTDFMTIFIFIILAIVLIIIIVVGIILLTQHKKNMKKKGASKASKDNAKKKGAAKSASSKSKGTPKEKPKASMT